MKKFAGPDESDYNLHLSNSSYPKVCSRYDHPSSSAAVSKETFAWQVIDEARMIAAIVAFPNFYRVGKPPFKKTFVDNADHACE
jgi:hypothetical protein